MSTNNRRVEIERIIAFSTREIRSKDIIVPVDDPDIDGEEVVVNVPLKSPRLEVAITIEIDYALWCGDVYRDTNGVNWMVTSHYELSADFHTTPGYIAGQYLDLIHVASSFKEGS